MAPKLTRVFQRIFGGSAPASPSNMAQFGSFANGTPTFTTDPAVIQALGKWLLGWNSAIVGGDAPAIEDMNAAFFVAYRQLVYIFQQGMPEYDASTEYFIGSYASFSGSIYKSLTNNNVGNTPTAGLPNWENTDALVSGWFVDTGSSGTSYKIDAGSPARNGMRFIVVAANTSTGGATVFSCDNGANYFPMMNGAIAYNPDAGQIVAGEEFEVYFTGAVWQTFAGTPITKYAVHTYGEINPGDLVPLVDQNDYSPVVVLGGAANNPSNAWGPDITILTLDPGANVNITGLLKTSPGHRVIIRNTNAVSTITLKNNSGLSAAGNRFVMNADVVLAAGDSAEFIYSLYDKITASPNWVKIS